MWWLTVGSGRRPQHHVGLGRRKNSSSTWQAVQTMSIILSTAADSMPHKTRTKKTSVSKGKKLVQFLCLTVQSGRTY